MQIDLITYTQSQSTTTHTTQTSPHHTVIIFAWHNIYIYIHIYIKSNYIIFN